MIFLAVTACLFLPAHADAAAARSAWATESRAAAALPLPKDGPRQVGRSTSLQRRTGLTITIDRLRPVALVKGRPLQLSGIVTNSGKTLWREAQVYLEVAATPATTKAELDAFASADPVYFTRLIALNLFDQIGNLPAGDSAPYHLSVPFHRLPIAGTPGVYHVGVSVLAGTRMGRDAEADARADTFIPLLPDKARTRLHPTSVVTLLPLTAPVLRQTNGNFLNDSLLRALTIGGRLRDALDFAARAPPNSVQVVLDPALRSAVMAMSRSYVIQPLRQAARGQPGHPGTGQQEAQAWLQELEDVARRQHLSLMTWASPDASALAGASLPGVVEAAVIASSAYATSKSLNPAIVGWQPEGLSTRRALSVARRSGTSVQIVSQRSLPRLSTDSEYPPSLVSLHTRTGPLTAVVTRSDIAGEPLTAGMTALQFGQDLAAEATVRALAANPHDSLAAFALPVNWNPGVGAGMASAKAAYRLPSVRTTSLNTVDARSPTLYAGPVAVPASVPPYPRVVLNAIPQMRNEGRIATGILSHHQRAQNQFDQRLAESGSNAWRRRPGIAAALLRQQAATYAQQISKVTVTGPAFVALSSTSGRFPLTVSNGLRVPITVAVDIRPANPALQVDSISKLRLAAGQRRDVQVVSRAQGSGLTQVWVRLSTPDHRLFGTPWRFSVRATQFGVIIWIAMAAGAAVLFGAAVVRIYRRIRESRAHASTKPAST